MRARDASPARGSQSPAMNVTQRCERPHDHRPHAPYIRPGTDVDFACPGGPPPPIDEVLFDLAVMAA